MILLILVILLTLILLVSKTRAACPQVDQELHGTGISEIHHQGQLTRQHYSILYTAVPVVEIIMYASRLLIQMEQIRVHLFIVKLFAYPILLQ